MKLLQPIMAILITSLFAGHSLAATYKCKDNQGNTSYQSSPCAAENTASFLNTTTGNLTDLSIAKKQQAQLRQQQGQLAAEEQHQQQSIATRKQQVLIESALNQQLIKDHPRQFSAFAIPPYLSEQLPHLIKQYENRLPDIERLRRFAAQKALASNDCPRVESDQLSARSSKDQLVFAIDCSSAKTFYFTEIDLLK